MSDPPRRQSPSLFPSLLKVTEERAQEPEGWAVRLLPLIGTLRNYQLAHLRPDFVAGLTTALFAVPQAMAYALIAGFTPTAGIATAAIASILGAAFGSSEFLINGPTNAISVMLAASAAAFAVHGDPLQAIVLLTLAIGAFQVVAGIARIGTLTRFVSEPVLNGFTAGAGVYIVVNQLPSFLGIERAVIGRDLWGWQAPRSAVFDLVCLLRSLEWTHATTAGLAMLTLVTVRVVQRIEPRVGRRLPAPFFGVVLATLVVWVLGLDHGDAAHRVKVVSDIEPLTRHLPSWRLPTIDFSVLRTLAGPAFAIGLMGSVEAIAIGKVLAARAGHPFDASRQLIGEGVCNLGAAAVGGFASSGSFSRTAVNVESGAITRISCVLSGLLVLLLVAVFAPQANIIPIAALAGTLVHVGLKLVDVSTLKTVFGTTTGDRAVLLSTFLGVILTDHIENGLFLGIAVSIFYALRRAEGFKLRLLVEGEDGSLRESDAAHGMATSAVRIVNLQGELFFAAADELQHELLRMLDSGARVIVLRVQEAYNMDATTAGVIAHVADHVRRRGGRLLLCGVRPGMYGTFERAGLLDKIGKDALFVAERELLASTKQAVAYAHHLHNNSAT